MAPDTDDTVVAPRRAPTAPVVAMPDQHATVPRGDVAPPVLVEPPPPAPAELPVEVAGGLAAPAPPTVAATATLPDGRVVDLATPVYLGRRPSVPRLMRDAPAQVVEVPSPAREVSATHVELRIVGTTVVATDLRSTNGTVVRIPGSVPQTLVGGDSAVVPDGGVVDLGEGNIVRIAVTG